MTTGTPKHVAILLKPLVGSVIQCVASDKAGEFYGIVVSNPKTKKTHIIWILSDEEGNNPGAIEITEEAEQ